METDEDVDPEGKADIGWSSNKRSVLCKWSRRFGLEQRMSGYN
jgi:hypothetical protein